MSTTDITGIFNAPDEKEKRENRGSNWMPIPGMVHQD